MRTLVVAVVLTLVGFAHGQQVCGPFSMTVSGTDEAELVCTVVSGTTYNLTVTAQVDDDSDGEVTCTINVTTTTCTIATATLLNEAGANVELLVLLKGSTLANHPVAVSTIVKDGQSNGAVTLQELRTSGNVGSVTVDSIGTVVIGQNLTGTITASNGNLGLPEVEGFVTGDAAISVPNGRIDFINMPNPGSSFGQSGNSASIHASDEIRDIFVYDRIWTSLLVREGLTSGAYGPVGRIRSYNGIGNNGATGSGELWDFSGFTAVAAQGAEGLYCDGNFRSNLTIHGNLTNPIEIGGSLLAHLTITGAASAPITVAADLGYYQASPLIEIEGNLTFSQSTSTPITSNILFDGDIVDGKVLFNAPYAGTLNIGGKLGTGAIIYPAYSTNPFTGQIIIDSLNTGSLWSGTVKYGSGGTTINHTAGVYTTTSATWGGGAVGLAAFDLHYEDCSPAHNAVVYPNFYTVVLRFYGPITSNDDLPVSIYYRPAGSTGSWTLDNANWSVVSGYGTRRLELLYFDGTSEPSFIPELREYKIVPATSGDPALLCDDLMTEDLVNVVYFEYLFETLEE